MSCQGRRNVRARRIRRAAEPRPLGGPAQRGMANGAAGGCPTPPRPARAAGHPADPDETLVQPTASTGAALLAAGSGTNRGDPAHLGRFPAALTRRSPAAAIAATDRGVRVPSAQATAGGKRGRGADVTDHDRRSALARQRLVAPGRSPPAARAPEHLGERVAGAGRSPRTARARQATFTSGSPRNTMPSRSLPPSPPSCATWHAEFH